MNRLASRALVAAVAATLVLSGVALAKDHPSHGKGADHGSPAGHAQKAGANVVAGLKTKGNAAHPGGVFRVLAIVKAAPGDRPATIDAIVHFASGDVAVVLSRHGDSKGAAYHADVPVPDAEPAGPVLIDATAVVGAATLTATGSGKIVVGGDTAEAPDAAESPEATDAPDTCAPTETPEANGAPDASSAPEGSEAPEAGTSPDASDTADDCDNADGPGFHLSADQIARLIAFLESLLA